MAGGVDGVPHAEHEEAGFADAHCPGYAFHCYLFGMVFIFWVDDLAIIVVVSGEDSHHVSDFGNEAHRVFFAQDVLVLITS